MGRPEAHRHFVFGEILEVKLFAGANADAREFRADGVFVRSRRGELQREVEIIKETAFDHVLVDFRKVDRGRGGRRRPVQVRRERLYLVDCPATR